MYEQTKRRDLVRHGDPDEAVSIPAASGPLVHDLTDPRYERRTSAVRRLIEKGEEAVAALAEALDSEDTTLRWRAAFVLSRIAQPSSAPALMKALDDGDFGVRWLAAEGLVRMGRDGLEPVLTALVEEPVPATRQEGVRHVFRILRGQDLASVLDPVLRALNSASPETEVPVAAYEALGRLEDGHP